MNTIQKLIASVLGLALVLTLLTTMFIPEKMAVSQQNQDAAPAVPAAAAKPNPAPLPQPAPPSTFSSIDTEVTKFGEPMIDPRPVLDVEDKSSQTNTTQKTGRALPGGDNPDNDDADEADNVSSDRPNPAN